MLFGWVSQMVVFIIWKLKWMKILFKITFKTEVVTALLEYVLIFSFKFYLWILQLILLLILLWILTLFNTLNISVNATHPGILRQSRLKWETKFNWRGHEFFSWKSYWAIRYLALWSPGLQNIFLKFAKPSTARPSLLHTWCTLPYFIQNIWFS